MTANDINAASKITFSSATSFNAFLKFEKQNVSQFEEGFFY